MTTKTPIAVEDIRAGDLIRAEYPGATKLANEWCVGTTWSPPKRWDIRYFLLDRPRKLIHAEGTTLYVTDASEKMLIRNGDEVVVSRDFYEGDRFVQVEIGGGRTISYYSNRFTDIKPDPHPVGAICWVTEDTKSPYGHLFEKGERFTVKDTHGNDCVYPEFDRLVSNDEGSWYISSKFLSATEVEAPPKTVTVPLDAVKRLTNEQDRALGTWGVDRKNDIRRVAITNFLSAVDSHA